jgi:hypothetical protein
MEFPRMTCLAVGSRFHGRKCFLLFRSQWAPLAIQTFRKVLFEISTHVALCFHHRQILVASR